MALSNIFNEPRREITESLVGIAIVSLGVGVCAGFVALEWWFDPTLLLTDAVLKLLILAACGAILVFAVVVFLHVTHALGDAACNAFQARGIHLRPRVRKP